MSLRTIPVYLLLILLMGLFLTTSEVVYDEPVEQARRYTLGIEYDYFDWTSKALSQKAGQSQINLNQFVSSSTQRQIVLRYFELIQQLELTQASVERIYTDPAVKDPRVAAASLLSRQEELETALVKLAPLAETVMQQQVATVFKEQGIRFIGQTLPPVLFHSSPLPKALIVSPRESIQQEVNISLLADLTLEDITALEDKLDTSMGASSLVVDVGGIGVYPTMVQRTSDLRWTLDTIAHEWVHNYLTLHPLGIRYDKTPELRTMNETTASIVGTEISQIVLQRYYPERAAIQSARPLAAFAPPRQSFDFRQEMRLTRIKVDYLLANGRISEAEKYMEQRRVFFVQNGYMIRKLNQAYFAFYGAYADVPGGAAGEDPVGPAVRKLREEAGSLENFLKQMARMRSFAQLQEAVN